MVIQENNWTSMKVFFESMTYFKSSFLNLLRDELGLTMFRQRLTVFHFFYLLFPAIGLAAGVTWGMQSHVVWKTFLGGAIGVLIGGITAWQLPKSLWKMLQRFASNERFLWPQQRDNVPVMTAAEFVARSKALRRDGKRRFLIWMFLFIAIGLAASRLCFYMDRAKPSLWVQVLAGCAIFSAFLIYFVFRSRIAKWIVRKHGLECPVCGKEITTVAGLAGMPHKGLCNQCGTKVIEINEPSASPKAENPA
jgi:hypothetical protein